VRDGASARTSARVRARKAERAREQEREPTRERAARVCARMMLCVRDWLFGVPTIAILIGPRAAAKPAAEANARAPLCRAHYAKTLSIFRSYGLVNTRSKMQYDFTLSGARTCSPTPTLTRNACVARCQHLREEAIFMSICSWHLLIIDEICHIYRGFMSASTEALEELAEEVDSSDKEDEESDDEDGPSPILITARDIAQPVSYF